MIFFRGAVAIVGYALGGSALITFIGLFLVGMLILSIIPIYTPDNSTPGYGESNWSFLFWILKKSFIYFSSIYYSRIYN